MSRPPTAIINYSWDSEDHKQRVLQFANRLRKDGIDVFLDQYETSPRQGWAQWMEDHICNDDFVLMICTPNYFEKVKSRDSDSGKGVKWEGNLIYNFLYDSETLNSKFIPVIFNESSSSSIPTPIRGATRYNIGTEEGYKGLYRHLTNQPRVIKPPVGQIKRLPPEVCEPFEHVDKNSISISDKKRANTSFSHMKTVKCAFCRASGDDNPIFGRICPVCDGKGIKKIRVSDQSELKKCSFCGGTGEDNPIFGRICPLCEGVGVNEIRTPYVKCPHCNGSGEENPIFGRICPVCDGTGYNEIK